jgi:hypothetical protein
MYVALFGTSPEGIALLNRAAPRSFRVMQDSVWDDVLLHFCALTDPAAWNPKWDGVVMISFAIRGPHGANTHGWRRGLVRATSHALCPGA